MPQKDLTEVVSSPRPLHRTVLGWTMAVVSITIVCAFAGFFVFAAHIADLKNTSDPPASDAIIVLTGGSNRIESALELLRQGKGHRLLISGVHPDIDKPMLERATGARKELFDCCIDIGKMARDTAGNARESARWVVDNRFSRVLLVTNNYHMPRSLLEARRVLRETEIIPYPVVNREIGMGEWLTRPEALRVLGTEYAKYVAALFRLRLSDTGSGKKQALAKMEVDQK